MEFVTQNGGVTVEVQAALFKDASNLKKAVAKGLKGNSLGLDGTNISDIKLDSIIQLLIDIDTSEDFERALMECLRSCIYDKGGKNLKINMNLFDDIPEAREDYYEIITKCCEENLRPFFKSLVSEFNHRLATIPSENQEQK